MLAPNHTIENEKYILDTTNPNNWFLQSASYNGFIRGLETFS